MDGTIHKRYAEAPAARYGLVASSRDKILAEWGIPNDYQSTKVMRLGPWYGDGDESHRSCRHLRECVTEFGAQGLELDGVLLAWGTDLMWTGLAWSNARAKNHARGTHVRDPYPAARQRLPRAAHARARWGGHLRPARDRARRHRRPAAGARGEGALSRFRGANVNGVLKESSPDADVIAVAFITFTTTLESWLPTREEHHGSHPEPQPQGR